MQTYTIDIRPRRQATFPRALLEEVGANVGDKLEAKIEGKQIIIKPKKQIALDAFKALQKAFQQSGIPEKEFQENIKRDREEYARKTYPDLYRH
ncbi:AbrB/MazE/SpoVT family DNA-binding domain-containing protein [Candidatus Gottesmanbacteria bacterium]|nr:AbrB/MazE/SpoVT family DNA-binding domain-containing protein [Candidatus Gottesmanbacteria bacterium]